ncbi:MULTISPECIES: MFS transporter [unclassified Sphingomonas]|uniref:MFS transporter n=1 Tax=unclassified Sphingomonas TaxID=196159 RepID=UPI0006FB7C7F|nr:MULTISPECIES: MFS transporter [unclassified Sphingomonas]KQX20903.1 MFS transporter [Sphingomonas sp. Root1294]KQY68749.1 MFS transporter [Sphingomonas sp. Root50]KRB88155.1 MFS transporter [Sphingomonas sp. Root720]
MAIRNPQPGASLFPIIETDVPARLDRLPWSRFHWLVVVALGITWILDGLEVTLAGSVAGALRESPVLRFTAADVGLANSAYLAGAVVGALVFGWLTDRLGRKKLFSLTLLLYLAATAGTAFAWDLPSFALLRFLTGAGIGGEYSAINSAIQELIPARRRGWTDLVINGSFWVGAALAGGVSIVLLDPRLFDPDLGWRIAFFSGAALGLAILLLRRFLPESPRWLIVHGRPEEADRIVAGIEAGIAARGHALPPVTERARLRGRRATPLGELFRTILRTYPRRTVLGLCLMGAQAFLYNAIFFTYAMMLTDFHGVPADRVGWYVLPFALGNVLGPLLLGRLFDTVGRRPMIVVTYALSGVLLAATGWLFREGLLDATTQTLCWSITFFFASAAASSAYLTVAESFPIEIRALTIAIFYALGTGLGGVLAPWLFGILIDSGSRDQVLGGYLLAAGMMGGAAIVAWRLAIDSERQPLESVARPLSWQED